jgi:hypothetical protein
MMLFIFWEDDLLFIVGSFWISSDWHPLKKETYNAYINFTSNIESADNVQNLETNKSSRTKKKCFPIF